MRKTLAHLTLSTTPFEMVSATAAAGFDGAGIRICGRHVGDTSFVDIIGDKAAIRDLRMRADDGGIEISNVSAFQFYPGLTLDHLRGVVETTAALEAKTLVVNVFIQGDQGFDLFTRYGELAKSAGLRLALEFLPYSAIRTMTDAANFICNSGLDNAGILLDSLHLDRSGGTADDIRALDKSLIAFAQICDAERLVSPKSDEELKQEARTARLKLGEGELPLGAFMDVLPDGIELEYEVADAAIKHLPAVDRAKAAMADLNAFLAARAEAKSLA